MKARLILAVLCGLSACRTSAPSQPAIAPVPTHASHEAPMAPRPQLVVQVTVDQLRADLPLRMSDRFGTGGFARFWREGVIYDNAHYAHAITETAVGHATLFTGALPKDHGIVGNEWFDLDKRARAYAVDDDESPLLGSDGGGKSPRRLLVPTIGDALLSATDGQSKVRAVSEKDRGAILPGGHKGLAYWLDDRAGAFITSRYYLEALPSWVSTLTVEPYRKQTLTYAPKSESTRDFTRALKHTPLSDEMVLDFVMRLVKEDALGADAVPDLLAVSFSATDYVGHAFGPESKQAEDNLVRLDATLEKLLSFLDTQIGQGKYVVVLSADHGIAESPEWFQKQGQDAGRIEPKILLSHLNQALRKQLAIDADLVLDFVNPSLWLDEKAISARGLDLTQVEQALRDAVLREPGFFAAFTRTDLLAGRHTQNALERRVTVSVHPVRSGHVYVVPKPHWLLATEVDALVAMHGTPHDYDTHVPIYVLGSGATAQRVERAVDPRDIAPTLAQLLHIDAPSGASGRVLVEAAP